MAVLNITSPPRPSPASVGRGERQATSRLLKVSAGRADVATVTVRLSPAEAAGVVADLDPPPDGYPPPANWVRAAVQGAEAALARLVDNGLTADLWRVTVTQILGTVSDTRPCAVRCAGGMAVWQGIIPTGPQPIPSGGVRLRLTYPAAPEPT